jgi:hypothetical protein
MKLLQLTLVAPLALLVAGCTADAPPPPPPPESAGMPEPVVTDATRQVPLQDMAQTGVSGELIVTPFQDSVMFHVVVNDAAAESTLGVRVHLGTCESPGQEQAVLEAVRTGALGNGRGQRTLSAETPHRLLDGRHVVAVYAQAAQPGRDRPMACAQVPAMQAPAMR